MPLTAGPGLGGDGRAKGDPLMYAFEFVKPSTVDEARTALADEDAQALGGGQTLIPTLQPRLASPATLVSLAASPR